jgi:hypothetical protein
MPSTHCSPSAQATKPQEQVHSASMQTALRSPQSWSVTQTLHPKSGSLMQDCV